MKRQIAILMTGGAGASPGRAGPAASGPQGAGFPPAANALPQAPRHRGFALNDDSDDESDEDDVAFGGDLSGIFG